MARTPTTTPVPATPSREDEVLIREIDEAVREDALYSFMRDHGIKVLGVILLGLAGLGGYLIWDYYSEKALEEQSETLISALDYMDKRDFKTASDKVAPLLAVGSAPGARAAARFIQAGAALAANLIQTGGQDGRDDEKARESTGQEPEALVRQQQQGQQ